jgi:hypothetical protein
VASRSLLDTIGSDIKGIFKWLASSTGQEVITTAEDVVEVIYPPATGIIDIINNWLAEILKTQALATAAGAQTGSQKEKRAMAISGIRSQLLVYAKNHSYPTPTQVQMEKVNDYLVSALNELNGR